MIYKAQAEKLAKLNLKARAERREKQKAMGKAAGKRLQRDGAETKNLIQNLARVSRCKRRSLV